MYIPEDSTIHAAIAAAMPFLPPRGYFDVLEAHPAAMYHILVPKIAQRAHL